jgi:hypothetical protein
MDMMMTWDTWILRALTLQTCCHSLHQRIKFLLLEVQLPQRQIAPIFQLSMGHSPQFTAPFTMDTLAYLALCPIPAHILHSPL